MCVETKDLHKEIECQTSVIKELDNEQDISSINVVNDDEEEEQ